MSISVAVARMSQIQTELASLQTAFVPHAATAAAAAAPTQSTATATAGSTGTSPNFAAQLASAMTPNPLASAMTSNPLAAAPTLNPAGGVALSGATVPPQAASMLTSDQQTFAARLAADTGMDSGVISAWLLAEESGGAATARQSASNNDWLNIGYTDSGTYGSSGSQWSNPLTAADATAGWLKGQNTIPGYGTASSGIQAILGTAGQPPATQIAALQSSGWASSGYPDLPGLYQQVAG